MTLRFEGGHFGGHFMGHFVGQGALPEGALLHCNQQVPPKVPPQSAPS
jgi:hypothetical protein